MNFKEKKKSVALKLYKINRFYAKMKNIAILDLSIIYLTNELKQMYANTHDLENFIDVTRS